MSLENLYGISGCLRQDEGSGGNRQTQEPIKDIVSDPEGASIMRRLQIADAFRRQGEIIPFDGEGFLPFRQPIVHLDSANGMFLAPAKHEVLVRYQLQDGTNPLTPYKILPYVDTFLLDGHLAVLWELMCHTYSDGFPEITENARKTIMTFNIPKELWLSVELPNMLYILSEKLNIDLRLVELEMLETCSFSQEEVPKVLDIIRLLQMMGVRGPTLDDFPLGKYDLHLVAAASGVKFDKTLASMPDDIKKRAAATAFFLKKTAHEIGVRSNKKLAGIRVSTEGIGGEVTYEGLFSPGSIVTHTQLTTIIAEYTGFLRDPTTATLYEIGETVRQIWSPDTSKYHVDDYISALSQMNIHNPMAYLYTGDTSQPGGRVEWGGSEIYDPMLHRRGMNDTHLLLQDAFPMTIEGLEHAYELYDLTNVPGLRLYGQGYCVSAPIDPRIGNEDLSARIRAVKGVINRFNEVPW